MKNILNLDVEDKFVDHIDRNPLNNQRSNLRLVNISENAINSKKRDGCTSKFRGVSQNGNRWCVSITKDRKQQLAHYDTELECAWQYNLWLDEFGRHTGSKNKIDEPLNFIPWQKTERSLPQYITVTKNGKFKVLIKYKNEVIHSSIHDTLDEAILAKEEGLALREKLIKDKQNIKYNEHGEAIIETINKGIIFNILVDEELYNDLIKISWRFKKLNNTITGYVNNKDTEMQKYIMNHDDKNTIIFHIDFNKLNNKVSNLIEIPKNVFKLFNLPIMSIKEGTSKYMGCLTVNEKVVKVGKIT